ncbi:MAG: hypothetical protein AAFR04_07060 [Pseudomonadota bacterium]
MVCTAGVALASALGGCATIVEGTSQKLTVNTAPQGANCVLNRNGERIGAVASTPGTVDISNSRHDILISCDRAGYSRTQATLNSRFQAMTLGNLLVGGVVGVVVDAGSGAMNKYDKAITIPMQRPGARPPRRAPRGRPIS